MKPQVNLRPDHHTTQIGLTPDQMLKLGTAVLLLALLITVVQGASVFAVQVERNNWIQTLANSSTELERTQKQFPDAVQAITVRNSVQELQKDLQEKQQLLTLISSGGAIQTKGFYSYLDALSQNTRQGMWLTELEIVPSIKRVRLKGITLDGDLVPKYIQDLRDTHFEGIQFAKIIMTQLDKQSNAFEFELDTPALITDRRGQL